MTMDNKIIIKNQKRLILVSSVSTRTVSDLLFECTVYEDLLRGNEVLQFGFGIFTDPVHALFL